MLTDEAMTNEQSIPDTKPSVSVLIAIGRLLAAAAGMFLALERRRRGEPGKGRLIVSFAMNARRQAFVIFIRMKKFNEINLVRLKQVQAQRYCCRPPCCWSAP